MFRCVLAVAVAAIVATPALAATEAESRFAFSNWRARYSKSYASAEEEEMRFAIYQYNAQYVAAHNAKGLSYTLGLNEFADLTNEEFKIGRVGGYMPRRRNLRSIQRGDIVKVNPVSLPASVDWSAKGAVTPIKNQGQCGSCWAFSTTGSVEGITFIKTGKLPSLSEQQLVDCSGPEGNQGCNGGLMDDAFKYIISNKGICSEDAYPYQGVDGTCQSSSCSSVASITGYTDVTTNDDTALQTAVVGQPVSVAVEADGLDWQLYFGGVVTGDCGTNLDHGVLAVGYGTDASSGNDYYKVKNSWGASWGEAGYIRLARGTSYNGGAGQCGIYSQPSYPVM